MSRNAKVSGSVVAGFPSPAEQYQETLGLIASPRVAITREGRLFFGNHEKNPYLARK